MALVPAALAVDFNRDIRPILSANCFACHGPDKEGRKADLRLDTFAGATADLGGYRALVPGKPDESELLARVMSDDKDELMPPPKTGHSLTAEHKQQLREWVESGGEYAEHWALVAPRKVALPVVSDRTWPSNAIDHFTLSRIEAAGLEPALRADPYQLLRRLSLDLTGLPPTVEDADRFAANPSPEAYAVVVEKLLSSPAFGEHWARMWLDLARFADTKGYEKDKPRTIWRFRDWVIDALNEDMPFDEFTLQQLAGDLLLDPSTEQLVATAFHRNTMVNEEGGTDDEEFRVAAVKDRVDTTMQVWMGVTMGCAKCHTHKYDPVSIKDYYATYAIFNQTQDADRGDDSPTLPTPTKQQAQQIAGLEGRLAGLQQQIETKPAGYVAAFEKWKVEKLEAVSDWQPLVMRGFESKHAVKLVRQEAEVLVATGKKPVEDEWRLILAAPSGGQAVTSLRLDVFPSAMTGSKWKQDNMTIQFDLELVVPGSEATVIQLHNARASFEQKNWAARFAIDDSPTTGWALSGGEMQHQVAVFDLVEPLVIPANASLRFRISFPYKHGLIPSGIRFSTSSKDSSTLAPQIDPELGWEEAFAKVAFPELERLRAERAEFEKQLAALKKQVPSTPVMAELAENKRRTTRIHQRGNFLDQAPEAIAAAVPGAFGQLPANAPADRAALARWLCSDENPLTARVMVNRVWARLFGIGIVETEEDFGLQGSVPSHPQLLDWLAIEYREGAWSLKSLLRTVVTSSAYRQSSAVDAVKLEKDPRNRLLSRGARFRLSAETVRDQALAASGLLTEKMGGPSVFPPQPPGVWKSTYSTLQWVDATDEDRYRRGLYTFLKRTSPHPAMSAFDAGSGEVCQIRRIRTNTPLQSLVTLNDPAFLEAAGALAMQMTGSGDELVDQLAHGFRRVLIRKPNPGEIQRLTELYRSIGADLEAGPFLASAGLDEGDPAMVAVASVILNLDETLTKP